MKKIFLLLLSGLLVAACFRHAGEEGEEPSPEPAPASSYLSFTLVSAQPVGTKAPGDLYNDNTYEDGTKEENNVSRVRFFFFDKDGKAAVVRKSASTENGYSWIDWYPSEEDNKGDEHGKTVEKILTATLGLSFTDENKPASVMAIINPTDGVLGLGNASLADQQGVVSDFETGLQKNNFVMSNSVYVAGEGEGSKAVYATELKEGDFYATPEAAVAAPVYIYVERVLARVDFTVNMTNEFVGDNIYELTDPDGHDYAVDGRNNDEKIYVKLLGWNTTTTANVSRLVKEVYPNWTSQGLFGSGSILRWNTIDYSRSFWALNPDPATSEFAYQIGNFGSVDGYFDVEDAYPANGNKIPETGEWSTVYLQENASAYAAKNAELTGPADASKVIIAAQLMEKVDGEFTPLSLAMWEYKHYTLKSLKTVFANRLDLYYEDENATAGYTKIKPEDIDFKTWEQLKDDKDVSSDAKTDDAEYYVYPVLSEDGKKKQWNKGGEQGDNLDLKQAQDRMREMLNRAMVWNSGLTYYFFDIRHLGEEGSVAETGIVRNHLYATTVTSIKGLGTPVYDPGQTIHPQVPEYDESFISAAVKILSWRVVSKDYEIEWK